MPTNKMPSSYTLSDECKLLIKLLSQHLGIYRTAVLEVAVRNLARQEHIVLDSQERKEHEDTSR